MRKQCDDSKSGIDATVALINALMNGQTSQNGSNEQEAVSADVINMVKSPWFDMFIKCIDELRGTRLELGAGRLSEMENALNSATNKQAMQPVQGEGLRTASAPRVFIGAAGRHGLCRHRPFWQLFRFDGRKGRRKQPPADAK